MTFSHLALIVVLGAVFLLFALYLCVVYLSYHSKMEEMFQLITQFSN